MMLHRPLSIHPHLRHLLQSRLRRRQQLTRQHQLKRYRHHGLVLSDQEKMEGMVMLDPSCSQAGRLTISVRFRALLSLLSPDGKVS